MHTIKMIKSAAVLIIGLLLVSNVYADNGSLVLRNISVIDGLGNPPKANQDVLITDGRIVEVSDTAMTSDLADDVKVIAGDGLTVMPGLIDMHVHLWAVRQRPGMPAGALQGLLNAYLYSGVTSVHDMDNDLDGIVKLRDDVKNGDIVGPNISTVGRQISRLETVTSGVNDLLKPEAQQEIRDRLDELQGKGIKIIKLYAGLSNWSARHIMKAAKERGMTGVADFWCTNLSLTGFQVTNVDGWAHGGCAKMQPYVAEWMRDNDKFAILTLSIFDSMSNTRPPIDRETRGFLSDPLIVDVMGKKAIEDYYENYDAIRAQRYEGDQAYYQMQLFGDMSDLLTINQHNLRALYAAGVLVGMGTDSPGITPDWPGESMHNELELHVQAGVSPIDAIQMATSNGAKILNWDAELGSVEQGKVADLLIVKGDPANNITDTRNVVHVIKSGKLLDRAAMVIK
jgi:hypothetical protein